MNESFAIVSELYKKLDALNKVYDIVKDWACYADDNHANDKMIELCHILGISVGWRFDE